MTLTTNDIATAYVAWVGGKRRPILIRISNDSTYTFFKITSQFSKKSTKIKGQYYQIKEWREAGLQKASWVDTTIALRVSKTELQVTKIGRLSDRDIKGIINFLSSKHGEN